MSKRLLVVGDATTCFRVVSRMQMERPQIEVTVYTPQELVSALGFGLPYYIKDEVRENHLALIPVEQAFKAMPGVRVRSNHNALKIFPLEKKVVLKDQKSRREFQEEYDQLVLAPGFTVELPSVDGANLDGIIPLASAEDALRITSVMDNEEVNRVVVVGAGTLGVETAANLAQRGMNVTIVTPSLHILPEFDTEIADQAYRILQEKGIEIIVNEKILTFIGNGQGKVVEAHTPNCIIPGDLIILTSPIKPDVKLAEEAGITIGKTGAIEVNENMETNIPDIYAVGSCIEAIHHVTGNPFWLPACHRTCSMIWALQNQLSDVRDENPLKGFSGTQSLKVFDSTIAKTGLSEKEARAEGFDVESVLFPVARQFHHQFEYKDFIIKLNVDKDTHRVLGLQAIGEGAVTAQVNTAASAIYFKARVEDFTAMDLMDSAVFSHELSPLMLAAKVMLNKLKGEVEGISPVDVHNMLDHPEVQLVDVRTEPEVTLGSLPGAIHIPLEEIRERFRELESSRPLVLISRNGRKAYLAACILKEMGFQRVKIMDGGLAAYPYRLK